MKRFREGDWVTVLAWNKVKNKWDILEAWRYKYPMLLGYHLVEPLLGNSKNALLVKEDCIYHHCPPNHHHACNELAKRNQK